jgi:sirohydrochlorin ferrochelatase
MKQAILYVCHGSRLKQACDEAISFIQRCQNRLKADIHQICFLELFSPSIKDGFESCVKQGATHIAIVPLLLLTAVHAKKDIPNEIQEIMEQYPSIKVTYGKPIGVHEKMADTVIERVYEMSKIEPVTLVVLIGRGSSDPDVVKDLQSIATLVKKRSGIQEVRTCFLHAAQPSFQEMLVQVSSWNKRNVIFVPYLLFTGLLMKEIEKKVKYAQAENPNIQLSRYLGYDAKVEEVFIERVKETIANKDALFTCNRGVVKNAASHG